MSSRAGTPDPREFRPHRTLLADGTVITGSGSVSVIVPIAGAAKVRVRVKLTGAGTIDAAYVRPDGTNLYTANNPSQVVLTGGAENKLDMDAQWGESAVKLTLTDTSTSSNPILVFDVMMV
jgi:hypothetical protein